MTKLTAATGITAKISMTQCKDEPTIVLHWHSCHERDTSRHNNADCV